jgi:hypothetical protein
MPKRSARFLRFACSSSSAKGFWFAVPWDGGTDITAAAAAAVVAGTVAVEGALCAGTGGAAAFFGDATATEEGGLVVAEV